MTPARAKQLGTPATSSARQRLRGFTLIELLVVMALVAMTAGLIVPSASRWVASAQERGWRQEIRAQLAGLPLRAVAKGAVLEMDASALRALMSAPLPDDVSLELDAPLRYGANGVASGGKVRLRWPDGRAEEWRVAAITGEVTP